tara:strand:- start:1313 stop:1951 length:639 start_codon:yes stop_codon:yes gene_type:complete
MNKISTLFLSIIFSINIAFSQDEIAKQILDQLSEKGNSYEDITAEFSFNFSNKNQGIDEFSEGKIWIKEDMYKLNMAADLSIINNGETLWYFMKDVPEVQIMESDSEDEMNPSKIFTIYERGYKYQYDGKSIINGKETEIINLYPKKSGAISKVILFVDTEKLEFYKIQIIDKEGGTSSYTIKSFITNNQVPESTFNFRKKDHPGVEIIDLR